MTYFILLRIRQRGGQFYMFAVYEKLNNETIFTDTARRRNLKAEI